MPNLSQVENWKPVEGYNGLYEVSNLGRIRRFKKSKSEWRLLKPMVTHNGYLHIHLSAKGKKRAHKIHRLVAYSFVDGFFVGADVNHIDCDKQNNAHTNLEWCTKSQNIIHSRLNNRKVDAVSYSVVDTQTGQVFQSIRSACRERQICFSTLRKMLFGLKENTTTLIFKAA